MTNLRQINSRSFSAKIGCSWSAKARISSVDAVHFTKSNVAQIICGSNINTHLTWFVEVVLNAYI